MITMEKKYLSGNVIGKKVIDSTAVLVGNVKDVSFDTEKKNMSLIVATKMGTEITVQAANIIGLGDVVLLNVSLELPVSPPSKAQSPKPIPSSTTPGLCSSCSFQNDAKANFCIKCGAKLK